jgi:TolA-binding protein
MKRTERHRLKQNELATTVALARARLEQHGRQIGILVAALVIVAVAAAGYMFWRSRQNSAAGELLARAMTTMDARVVAPTAPPGGSATTPAQPAGTYPTERAKLEAALPKFMAAADAHPSSRAGVAARYQAAGILVSLGRFGEAEQRYREVIDRGHGIYADMARLGLAEALTRAGKHEEAIKAWNDLSGRSDEQIPRDAILLQLGRAYEGAGRTADASQAYKRVVDEFPGSEYAAQARRQLDVLPEGGK